MTTPTNVPLGSMGMATGVTQGTVRRVLGSPAIKEFGFTNRFLVSVDGIDLGGWATCKGLNLEFKTIEVNEGGVYDRTNLLPERMSYSPITLTRAMRKEESAKVQSWLRTVVDEWMNGFAATAGDAYYEGWTMEIKLLGAEAEEVASWTFRDVYPKTWKGPDLDANTARVAIEELAFNHHGFL